MCDDARLNGITGVPVTVIDGKWAVSGSQSSEVFLQVRWQHIRAFLLESLFCLVVTDVLICFLSQIFQKLADGVHISPPPFAASVLETDCSAWASYTQSIHFRFRDFCHLFHIRFVRSVSYSCVVFKLSLYRPPILITGLMFLPHQRCLTMLHKLTTVTWQ